MCKVACFLYKENRGFRVRELWLVLCFFEFVVGRGYVYSIKEGVVGIER